MRIEEQIMQQLSKDINNSFDKLLIDGLILKGYKFFDRLELEVFIKEYCRCADDLRNQTKTYYVKNIPFLLHCYKTEINPIVSDKKEISINADLGFYKYL